MLQHPGLAPLYVGGDNAALELVSEIAARLGPIPLALLFAGGAKTALLGDAFLTLSSAMAADAARILDARYVVPVHVRGWGHFTEGPDTLEPAFDAAGLRDRLIVVAPGESAELPADAPSAQP